MMILAIATVIGFGMADTYGTDEGCIELSGIDMSDAELGGSEAMAETIRGMSSVKNVRTELWMSYKFTNKKFDQSVTTRGISDTSTIKGGYVIEGRWPKNPNEVMFAANAANKLNVNVGDTVTVKTDSVEESFIVCGINQTFNNLGLMGYMTLEGMSRLSKIPDSIDVCVNLKPGVTYADFERELKDIYPDVEAVDVNEAAHQTVGMITIGMKAFAFLIAGLTILSICRITHRSNQYQQAMAKHGREQGAGIYIKTAYRTGDDVKYAGDPYRRYHRTHHISVCRNKSYGIVNGHIRI